MLQRILPRASGLKAQRLGFGAGCWQLAIVLALVAALSVHRSGGLCIQHSCGLPQVVALSRLHPAGPRLTLPSLQAERDALAAQLQQAEAARQALAAEREGLDGKLSWSEQSLAALQVARLARGSKCAVASARVWRQGRSPSWVSWGRAGCS